jgi:hypothetical protein
LFTLAALQCSHRHHRPRRHGAGRRSGFGSSPGPTNQRDRPRRRRAGRGHLGCPTPDDPTITGYVVTASPADTPPVTVARRLSVPGAQPPQPSSTRCPLVTPRPSIHVRLLGKSCRVPGASKACQRSCRQSFQPPPTPKSSSQSGSRSADRAMVPPWPLNLTISASNQASVNN